MAVQDVVPCDGGVRRQDLVVGMGVVACQPPVLVLAAIAPAGLRPAIHLQQPGHFHPHRAIVTVLYCPLAAVARSAIAPHAALDKRHWPLRTRHLQPAMSGGEHRALRPAVTPRAAQDKRVRPHVRRRRNVERDNRVARAVAGEQRQQGPVRGPGAGVGGEFHGACSNGHESLRAREGRDERRWVACNVHLDWVLAVRDRREVAVLVTEQEGDSCSLPGPGIGQGKLKDA
mmetsp:Transcript_36272/g.64904  ORF Transcript_36272/g.64904 Transcript_36272/m.64904 type:complete len:230 (-) Transcript_36272:1755-2444(-)